MTEQFKEWWCPKCNGFFDGAQVTFDEVHECCGTQLHYVSEMKSELIAMQEKMLKLETSFNDEMRYQDKNRSTRNSSIRAAVREINEKKEYGEYDDFIIYYDILLDILRKNGLLE